MWHNPLTREYERKLLKLQRLAELVEDTLVAQTVELDTRLSAQAERHAEGERDEFFEYYAEDYYELSDELPTLLRYSVLVGADTGLEVYLNETCRTFAELHKAALTLKDLRGAGIERARDYLKKVARMPFPDMQPEWTVAKRLHELRNAIVHSDGYILHSRDELRKWSSNMRGLRITGSGVISLDRDFTTAALDAYRTFATQVDDACQGLDLWLSEFPIEDV